MSPRPITQRSLAPALLASAAAFLSGCAHLEPSIRETRTEELEPLGEKQRKASADLKLTAAGEVELRARGADEQLVRRTVRAERELGFVWVNIAIGPHSEDAETYASASGSSWIAEAVLTVLVVPVNLLWSLGSLVEAPVAAIDGKDSREIVQREEFQWDSAKLVDVERGSAVRLHPSGAGSGGEQSWLLSIDEICFAGLNPDAPTWELRGENAPPVEVAIPEPLRAAVRAGPPADAGGAP